MIESRPRCENVPIKALSQAVLRGMHGSTASQRVCQPDDSCRFHQASIPSHGFRPNSAASSGDGHGAGQRVQPWMCRIANEQKQRNRFQIDQDIGKREDRPAEVPGGDDLD